MDYAFRRSRLDLIDSFHYVAREIEQRLGMRRVFPFEHRRLALVSGFADLGIELNAAEEVDAELPDGLLCSAARKNINFIVAMRTDKVAHVLDYASDINLHLAEHLDGLARVLQ